MANENETDFNSFLEEFRDYHDDMLYEIGGLGLANIRKENDVSSFSDTRDDLYFNRMASSDGYSNGGWSSGDIGQGQSDLYMLRGLMEDLKSHTYTVNVANLFSDLTFPLFEKLDALAFDQQTHKDMIQNQNSIYLSSILRAVRSLKNSDESGLGFLNYLQSSFQTFMRAPFWNSITGILRGVKFGLSQLTEKAIIPAAKGIWRGLFGREDSLQKKTLNELKKQTEFMRTGEIGGRGLLDQIKEQGLIGTGARGLIGSFADSRDEYDKTKTGKQLAQERQSQKERGLDLSGSGMKGWIADRIYKDDVTKRSVAHPVAPSSDLSNNTLDNDSGRVDNVQRVMLVDRSIMSLSKAISPLTLSSPKQLPDQNSNSVETVKILPSKDFNRDVMSPVISEFQNYHESEEYNRLQDIKRFEEEFSQAEETNNALVSIKRHTKETANESEKLRRQGLLGMIGGLISGVVSSVGNVLSMGLNAISSSISVGLGAAGAAALLGGKKIIGGLSGLLRGGKAAGTAAGVGGAVSGTSMAASGASGGAAGAATKGTSMLGKAGSFASRAAPWMIYGQGGYDAYKTWTDDEASVGEKVSSTGGIAGGVAGSIAGLKAGGAGGAAIGTMLGGPVGGIIGGAVGGIGGTVGGGLVGSGVGEKLVNWIPGVGDSDEKSQTTGDDPGIFGRIWSWVREVPSKVKEGVSSALNEQDDEGRTRIERYSKATSDAASSLAESSKSFLSASKEKLSQISGTEEGVVSTKDPQATQSILSSTKESIMGSIGGSSIQDGDASGSSFISSANQSISSGFESLAGKLSGIISGSGIGSKIDEYRQEGVTQNFMQHFDHSSSRTQEFLSSMSMSSVEAVETATRTLNTQMRTKESTDKVVEGVSTSNEYLKKMTAILAEMQGASKRSTQPLSSAEDNSGLVGNVTNFMKGGIPGIITGGDHSVF